ncbi:4-(cytidine 5'-diphospho)-2-C-methyl-D-erythritol kinase, partial [Candidatus Pelagibacter bacterium]|nr:4-(cytidine 5'-diphospho)-2-C-methyl-D-erythritol kinase [Candidatus Pelagibacter bacterium]
MVFKSFSKINLSLNVNRKLKNGLHQIQSHFCLVDLFDEIKIKKNRTSKDKIKFLGKFSKNIKKKDNSVINTLKFLRKKRLIKNYFSVSIKKH